MTTPPPAMPPAPGCPGCGHNGQVRRLLYGKPGPAAAAAATAGEAILAGCAVPDDGPVPLWACRTCATRIPGPGTGTGRLAAPRTRSWWRRLLRRDEP